MSDTAAPVVTVAPVKSPSLAGGVWNFLTSLKLAVVLLGLSALLVFLGTLAQVHEGLYLAQERWFKSWWILRQKGTSGGCRRCFLEGMR